MPSRCSCFASPGTFRHFSLVSSFCGTNITCKIPRPRALRRPTRLSDRDTVRGEPSHHSNWEARRYQHGAPPRTHSSPIRPKQSLGQNFLQDRSIVSKIVNAFNDSYDCLSPTGTVVEIGAGTGALTSLLRRSHEGMLAVEIDGRAVDFLRDAHPDLDVLHADVLGLDWDALAGERGRPLAVVGNLPYNIVSQILFSMFEARAGALSFAVVMMQREVAERICARTRTKAYGILSVVGQLYARPTLLFDVPNTAFYPRPSVTSAMVRFEFVPHPCLDAHDHVLTGALRTVVRAAFQQRRKTLRNSLRAVCEDVQVQLREEWAGKRPEELAPEKFVELTRFLYAERLREKESSGNVVGQTVPVWRPRKS